MGIHFQGRIQEVTDRGSQGVINFGTLENGTLTTTPLPPPAVNLAPLLFSSLELLDPPGHPCLCLNGALFVMLIYLFLSFYFFPSFSFPFSSFSFFFGAALVTRGAEALKTPRIRPCFVQQMTSICLKNPTENHIAEHAPYWQTSTYAVYVFWLRFHLSFDMVTNLATGYSQHTLSKFIPELDFPCMHSIIDNHNKIGAKSLGEYLGTAAWVLGVNIQRNISERNFETTHVKVK